MDQKVLILNRAEIANRIAIACKEMGFIAVGLKALDDQVSRIFDYVIHLEGDSIGETYLDIPKIISICQKEKINFVHPGYGFLSENPEFVEELEKNQIGFIGPTSDVIKKMGLKIESKQIASDLGVPVLPWASYKDLNNLINLRKDGDKIGYPLIIKASAGGGGRGMRIVHNGDDLEESLKECMTEASRNFKVGEVFLEKFVGKPRHIEVQILGDGKGNVVHLGTRECSTQRRYQKIIEEAPASGLPEKLIAKMCQDSVKLGESLNYRSLGTIEYIYDGEQYYFLEMNTRIQVEHPVTELVTRVDLVHEQLKLTQKNYKLLAQKDIEVKGSAIECRVCAESPSQSFTPSIGKLLQWEFPNWPNIRIDSGVEVGFEVRPIFDSMLAKVCAYAKDRESCINRLICYLSQCKVLGVEVNIDCIVSVLKSEEFKGHEVYTNWLDKQKFDLPDFSLIEIANIYQAIKGRSNDIFDGDLVDRKKSEEVSSVFCRVKL